MTYSLTLPPRSRKVPFRLEAVLHGLIRRHGRWRVIRAALLARPNRQPNTDDLNPTIKRDLGLPLDAARVPSPRQHLL